MKKLIQYIFRDCKGRFECLEGDRIICFCRWSCQTRIISYNDHFAGFRYLNFSLKLKDILAKKKFTAVLVLP